jgi:antitoxin Phd
MEWQLQEAKAKFSEVVQKAIDEGPQTVTRRGKEVVVIVSAKDFHGSRKPQVDLKELLASAPLEGVDLERPDDYGREVDF